MQDDLIGLQQSSKTICNPFGFDFRGYWGKKPIIVKGDGEPRTVIGPLRDHLARHLFMKVRYRYHDEQVQKLKDLGRDKDARKFNVPTDVENKIWNMITGEETYPRNVKKRKHWMDEENAEEELDLSELSKGMSKLDETAVGSSDSFNVSSVIEQANKKTFAAVNQAKANKQTKESLHTSGSAALNGKSAEKPPGDKTPIAAEAVGAPGVPPSATEATPPKSSESEFGDLNELE